MSFFEEKTGNRAYEKSDLFNKENLVHGFTQRIGGVSEGKISGFNLGFRVGDSDDNVKENYKLLANDLKFSLDRAVLSHQTHTDNIRIVTESDWGKGIKVESDIFDTDGLITNLKNTPLIVFSADCTPIIFYDAKKGVIAAVHAGWRGTVKKIAVKCVNMMIEKFKSSPSDIIAAVGPSIGSCCFEFGEEAPDIFDKKYLTKKDNGKYLVDLWSFNEEQLLSVGIPEKNIDVSRICTVCNSDKFYSYRVHKEHTGRMVAVIMQK